jgi:transcriptional regulator with XRE-family HTH domain
MTEEAEQEAAANLFPVRLLRARRVREMTQRQLADKAGLPHGSISHFESGLRKPSFDNLIKLADALGMTTDYLLGREMAPFGAGQEMASLFQDLSRASESDLQLFRAVVYAQKLVARISALPPYEEGPPEDDSAAKARIVRSPKTPTDSGSGSPWGTSSENC